MEKIVNRRARHLYTILSTHEAGIVLTGSEVKSLRLGKGSLVEAFARIARGEAWIHNFLISPYQPDNEQNYDPSRPRKLLLHKREIMKIQQKMEGSKLTLVPLVCYTTGRRIKIQLGLGRGKKEFEKRAEKRKRDLERQALMDLHDANQG